MGILAVPPIFEFIFFSSKKKPKIIHLTNEIIFMAEIEIF